MYHKMKLLKRLYDESVRKVNAIDTSKLVKKQDYNAKILKIKFLILLT